MWKIYILMLVMAAAYIDTAKKLTVLVKVRLVFNLNFLRVTAWLIIL